MLGGPFNGSSVARGLDGLRRLMKTFAFSGTQVLAVVLAVAVAAYLGWKISQSAEQALQFAFNGLSVGAVYALVAIGFTLVYSTVWFFDLYYGAAAAVGAYGVYYLRSQQTLQGQYEVNDLSVNIVFAAVVAGVTAWALHAGVYPRLRTRFKATVLRVVGTLVALGAGLYTGFVLAYPDQLNVTISPAISVLVAIGAGWLFYGISRRLPIGAGPVRFVVLAALPATALGAYSGFVVANAPGANLYISWGVSCLLAGAVGLALYRGLYVSMRERAKSPLVILVASLGVLLAISALIAMVFQSTPRPLPDAFGSDPWTIGGANIKGFNVFTVGVAIVGFLAVVFVLKRTAFGKAVRAIGDDEEVAKVVGINTTSVIAVVFFIGAAFAALGGILSGHDTAIHPRMGLLLLLNGWIASVIGGIGNIYGAIVGGFVLGMVQQFGIWDVSGEWRDAISFGLLILFLSFWPKGLLPRR